MKLLQQKWDFEIVFEVKRSSGGLARERSRTLDDETGPIHWIVTRLRVRAFSIVRYELRICICLKLNTFRCAVFRAGAP